MTEYKIIKETKNPNNGRLEDALWHYNYKGFKCLVEFPGGVEFTPDKLNFAWSSVSMNDNSNYIFNN